MEQNLVMAIEQFKQKEEAGLNYIYSKTYNYMYLRAKTLLKRENDIQGLMKEVYTALVEASEEITRENLYEWLGKKVYVLGCQKYRKKKAREAVVVEMDRADMEVKKGIDVEESARVMAGTLEELPDLYQATFYAFYRDQMSVKAIAEVFDCSVGVILNRLNYTRKYMMKALENHQAEKNVKVAFTIQTVAAMLETWSIDNCLGLVTAQQIYNEICKQVTWKANGVYLDGIEFAGVKRTVVLHKADDLTVVVDEIEKYLPKEGLDKRKLALIGVVGVITLVVICMLVIAFGGTKKQKSEAPKKDPVENVSPDENTDEQDVDTEPEAPEEPVAPVLPEEPQVTQPDASEYIFPESNTRKLTKEEIRGHSKEELRLARNEIFARHGMIFGIEDLDQYFGQKSWYQPTIDSAEFYDKVEMSMIEEENIVLIQEVEAEME